MSMETSRETEQQALAWLTRQEIGPWSESDQSGLDEWLRADTAHRVTYLRLEAGWERTGRLKTFSVGAAPGVVPRPGEWRRSPFFEHRTVSAAPSAVRRSAVKVAALAAGILLATGTASYLTGIFSGKVYETALGVVTSIPLSDGSSVVLNTGSKLRVSLSKKERRIELEAGEAFFDVAKDPSRPFVVQAGERTIVAVGTRFSVRKDGADIKVILTEGRVRVGPGANGGAAELLVPGVTVRTRNQVLVVQKSSLQEAEQALSWRSGYLTFDKTSLADAVAEFNRYSPQRIVIDDPRLAALRISGKFRSTYAADFVQVLQKGFGVQVERVDENIHLTSN